LDPPAKDPEERPFPRREAVGLGVLFGAMYFIQGISEPTAGLLAQPVIGLLKQWGRSASDIMSFMALLAIPWSIKPLYGLLSDFLPIAGSRRKSYLLLTSAATAAGLLATYWLPLERDNALQLWLLLLLPTVGVAFSDVVVDALMVEKGQPAGLTGRLQSIQWASIYAATIVVGALGGYLTQHKRADLSFLICGTIALGTFGLALFFVKEKPRPAGTTLRAALGELVGALRSRSLIFTGAFLLLWNFNPFSAAMLNVYYTQELGFEEQFFGNLTSLGAGSSIAASIAYGFYCRRVPFPLLLRLSIVCGVVTTLCYAAVRDKPSAIAVTLIADFTYMTGILIQLDLAARSCPVASAGTVFALLMSLTNLGTSLATAAGGYVFDVAKHLSNAQTAFTTLVVVGALTNACCWLLLPLLRRAGVDR
jgi:MFS family permease